ncbi:hypothetical protein BD560DRAFT_441429 [Blakeslea trispora]|nr:hypothetical protein BD560DRAFT_441427 [Blakeslea trispora]KAI8330535.1 hypothetical protein BD560DRAFT_441428 [Blakeslea trispora]KAI8330536.1 hypothetical protein BD560DRAFT_441429 [Blakeslea trispora]
MGVQYPSWWLLLAYAEEEEEEEEELEELEELEEEEIVLLGDYRIFPHLSSDVAHLQHQVLKTDKNAVLVCSAYTLVYRSGAYK